MFLSSHSSPRSMSTLPSPQRSFCVQSMPGVTHENPGSILQVDEQPSLLVGLPSSQASPASSIALPHTLLGAATHLPMLVVGSFVQVKPGSTCLQSAEQPVAPVVSPLSPASCGSTLPLPQTQTLVQVSPATPPSGAAATQR